MKTKTFKSNATITVALVSTEFLVSVIPAILIIYAFFGGTIKENIFATLAVVPVLIVVVNVVLFLISLIQRSFTKTTYTVHQDCITEQSAHGTVTVEFADVDAITYDLGNIDKWDVHASRLLLSDKDYRLMLSVKNPPLGLIHALKTRCNCNFRCVNKKRFLFFLILINALVLLFCIAMSIFA